MGVDILAAVRKFQFQCYAFMSKLLEHTGLLITFLIFVVPCWFGTSNQ